MTCPGDRTGDSTPQRFSGPRTPSPGERAPNQGRPLPPIPNPTSSPPSDMQVRKQCLPAQDQPAEPKLICRYPMESAPNPGIPGTNDKDDVTDYADYESYMYMYEGCMSHFLYKIVKRFFFQFKAHAPIFVYTW